MDGTGLVEAQRSMLMIAARNLEGDDSFRRGIAPRGAKAIRNGPERPALWFANSFLEGRST
jgi:hypothetical protein